MFWQTLNNTFKLNRLFVGVLSIIMIIHLPLLFNDFHTDDFQVLEITHQGFTIDALKSMENPVNFRPVVNFIIYLRHWLLNSTASLWYLLNILLHLLVVALLYVYVKRVSNQKTAIWAALFFGLYFQHFEAVLWLYGIVRLLTAIYLLLTLIYFQKIQIRFSNTNLAAGYAFFFMGLFCAEDMIVLCLYFLFICLAIARQSMKRNFPYYGAGFLVLTGLYILIRSLVMGHPGLSTPYFFIGGHIWENIFSYSGWLIFPALGHPYILPFIKSQLPGLLPFLKPLAWLAFALALMSVVYIIRKGNRVQKQALLLTIIALIPALIIQGKVSTKLVYIPSIGVAILAASFVNQAISKAKQSARRFIYGCLIVYFICQSVAIVFTINYYRTTQKTVATLLDELDRFNINWDKYEYMLFDNVPGRAKLGKAFKYRHRNAPILLDNVEEADNLFDLDAEKRKLEAAAKTYILIDFSGGQPTIIESSDSR